MFQQAAPSVSDYFFCSLPPPSLHPRSRAFFPTRTHCHCCSNKHKLQANSCHRCVSFQGQLVCTSSCSIGTSSCKVWFNKRTSKTCAQVNKGHHAQFLNTSNMTQRLSFQQPHALFIHQFIRRVASLPHARSVARGRSATQDALCCFSASRNPQ